MVRMIPPYPRDGANVSEKKVFTALEGIQGRGIHRCAVLVE